MSVAPVGYPLREACECVGEGQVQHGEEAVLGNEAPAWSLALQVPCLELASEETPVIKQR